MEEIIAPISKDILKAELTEERRMRFTNKSNNEIYVVTAHNAPNVMREIGRLREIAFRAAGGGTGKSMDIDEYDIMPNPYKQLVVWNPEAEEILGGYRYLLGDEVEFDEKGHPVLATAHMFEFSEKFLKEYLPYTVELGRSFVTLEYQSSRAGAKGLFALDNLWDGLGALTVIKPNMRYFFGKELGLLPEELQNCYRNNIKRETFCELVYQLPFVKSAKVEPVLFTDTKNSKVQHLAGLGIINGVGDGLFAPNSLITREEAATILNRVLVLANREEKSIGELFGDDNSISDWAKDSVYSVRNAGVMNGMGDNMFVPKGNYTTEQAIITVLRVANIV